MTSATVKKAIEFMTPGQLAAHWHKNPEVIRRWLREGRLPYVRLGPRSILISMKAIRDFERLHRVVAA